MMLKSNTVSQGILGGSVDAHGLNCGFMDQNAGGNESWNTTSDEFPEVENNKDKESEKNNQFVEVTTAVWAIVEEEPDESSNGFNQDGDIGNEEETKTFEAPVKLDPVPIKTDENNLQWKIVPNTKVVSSIQHSRKMNIPRSISLTEKELREAQLLSDHNASQLSPSGNCSRGAQLFHRRRQKLKALEEKKLAQQQAEAQRTKHAPHGPKLSDLRKTELQFGSRKPSRFYSMEETSINHENTSATDDIWADETKDTDFPPVDKRAPSPSASEEDHQGPLSAYLKETLKVSNSNTNGLVIESSQEIEPPVKKEQNGSPNTQYCEVHLTLSKPVSVTNRSAKPFGGQSSAKRNVPSSEKGPTIELPPPPTYAETLSSPPPVTRVRSPPAYSALYPIEPAHTTPVHAPVQQVINHGEPRLTPQPKTGILESISTRKGPKKSMFTFIEKPKMAPNPELLSMVQNADERRKQVHGDVATEDEPFALGAEASNFLNKSPNAADNADQADAMPNWSSSLKSPGISPKPPRMPVQGLSEDKGKGAELFARRQSRMERFVVDSPAPIDSIRSPSPTMSLPPSWKFGSKTTPPPFTQQPKNNQRSPKLPASTPVTNTASETMQSKKELEISKRQPYKLQSSLFILSPAKDPVSTLPKAAPPPKPMVLESHRFARQTSCPTSPVVPSPTMYSPSYFQSIRSPSSVNISPSPVPDTPPSYGRRTPTSNLSPISPVPFSNMTVSSPRNKTVIQAPRPTFSAKNAGLESQKLKEFIPGSSNNKALQHSKSLDGWASSSASLQSYDERLVIQSPPPPRSMSPAWSDRSQSPSPLRMENDPKAGKQMKALLARNIINAAKRKSTSPWGVTSPQSPVHISTPWSPTVGNGSSLPETPRARRSPTGSDISIESEDSGAKSPGFRSYPFSPRGWYGSLRLKRDSLPSGSPFQYTP
ncbi:synaptopodin [Hyla sarda]|uniref:synaptopodin n=1 Tax=Hyla sarda TaxID=327740 RepID=UPI0024C41E67|nr:synaptopodin [Hyla sarda]XP_056372874.1 synaptopodin [Hyla sarda]XP_056372875.1 synaptopodin [Hyla sarda]XP_056372876.1 synaptopodin [Hyla sarda]XP_056372877.1 synaptopodin [Hyla sarda]